MKRLFYIMSLLIIGAVAACNQEGELPGEFITVSDANWPYGQALVFNADGDTLPLQTDAYELILRHTNAYGFSNLWIELAYTANDSLQADTFNIPLADDYGKWYGSGRPVVTFVDTIRTRELPDSGSRFSLRHIMRLENVTEIEQIGLRPVVLQ